MMCVIREIVSRTSYTILHNILDFFLSIGISFHHRFHSDTSENTTSVVFLF
jgi:hypothetical protein